MYCIYTLLCGVKLFTLLYCPLGTVQNLCLDYEGIMSNQIPWPPVNMVILRGWIKSGGHMHRFTWADIMFFYNTGSDLRWNLRVFPHCQDSF